MHAVVTRSRLGFLPCLVCNACSPFISAFQGVHCAEMQSLLVRLCLVTLALGTFATPNVGGDLPEVSLSSPACWVLTHNNKAGGSSVKVHLTRYAEARNRTLVVYNAGWYSHGDEALQNLLGNRPPLIAGGYTEGLRATAFQGCKWFTIMRQ